MSRRTLRQRAEARLASERGAIAMKHPSAISVCLVYPNTYAVGMSSLGFQGVYAMLNSRSETVCERAFLPEEDELEEYVRTGVPVMSMESGRGLAEFDIIAFSVSFENDYPNLLSILNISGIPLRRPSRTRGHPLIIMGGVCAMSNPEPVAEVFDAVLIGEAEGMLEEFMDAYAEGGGKTEEFFKRAAGIGGVYLPWKYELEYDAEGAIAGRSGSPERIKRRYCKDISQSPIVAPIVSAEAEFADMRLVEAMRGCTWKCKFCLAGHLYNPPRPKSLEAITRELCPPEGHAHAGVRVGLIGPSLTDYRHRHEVLGMPGVEFSITSLRASPESARLVSMMQGPRSVSIAPEAGTARLREYIDKRITEEDILGTAAAIFACPTVRRLRLYFMVGLPSETEEDMEGIVELVGRIRGISARCRIDLTVSLFVPKPFTPFERMPMARQRDVKARLNILRRGLREMRGVSLGTDRLAGAYAQGLLAMGDRRLLPVVEGMAQGMGYAQACREAGVDADYYIHREKGVDERLPWGFIEL